MLTSQRKSPKVRANEALEIFIARDFADLDSFVKTQESQWRFTHGAVSTLESLRSALPNSLIRFTVTFNACAAILMNTRGSFPSFRRRTSTHQS